MLLNFKTPRIQMQIFMQHKHHNENVQKFKLIYVCE